MHHYNFTTGQVDKEDMNQAWRMGNQSTTESGRRRMLGTDLQLADDKRPGRELAGRQLFDLSCLKFTGCCLQICIPTPLSVQFNAQLTINNGVMQVSASLRIVLDVSVYIPGNWPSFDHTFSTTLTASYGAGTSMCDIIPAFGDFVRNTGLGGGQECGEFFFVEQCKDLPSYTLADFIGCDRFTIG